jgi:isoaspartyl peptidase/L-asparaginase-like protein (Ntn-hydrolase superfamily)
MQYLGEPLKKATQWVVSDLKVAGGEGGVIAIDEAGHGELLKA